jgi:hypothetical protein
MAVFTEVLSSVPQERWGIGDYPASMHLNQGQFDMNDLRGASNVAWRPFSCRRYNIEINVPIKHFAFSN